MAVLIDKCILLVCCASLITLGRVSLLPVLAILLAITLSALNSYLEKRAFCAAGFSVYCLLGVFLTPFRLFLPLVYYDVFAPRFHWLMLLGILPLAACIQTLPFSKLVTLLLFTGISLVLKLRTVALSEARERYRALRDDAKEFSLQLERKNKDLMEKQDYEISWRPWGSATALRGRFMTMWGICYPALFYRWAP